MKHADFKIGSRFVCGTRKWLVTDVGTRTVVAVCLTASSKNDYARGLAEAQQDEMWARDGTPEVDPSWLKGPPYALEEHVFDENDIQGCKALP